MRTFHKTEFMIRPGFCFGISLIVLMIPIQWITGWVLAAVIHELSHYLALKVCGVRVYRITVDITGAVMETAAMNCREEAICALAGPAGGAMVLLIGRWMPYTAICAAFHTLYNLLPILPLDGGRALLCVLQMFLPGKTAGVVQKNIERIVLLILLVSSVAAWVLKLGILPFIFVCGILLKNIQIKIPCKPRQQIVQ